MSDKGSVFQKGGGGTNFEQSIQAAFMVNLAIAGNAPCLPSNEITEVSLQNTSKGYETDDLLVVAKSDLGSHRLLLQIKHDISFTKGSATFKEVLQAFWKDYNNSDQFDRTKDKLIIVKGGLTRDERNHFKSLFNWANSHATEKDFIEQVNRIKAKKDRLTIIKDLLKEVNGDIDLIDKEIWEFCKCMDVLEYDLLQSGSVDKAHFLNLIKLSKSRESDLDEKEIWHGFLAETARLNKDGGNVTTESVRKMDIYKHFSVENLIPHFKAIEKLKSDGSAILEPLKNTIGEVRLSRPGVNENIHLSNTNHSITIVTGIPGVGKSAQVKDLLQHGPTSSSAFVFRADQFGEPHIANVFSNQGIDISIHEIFSCISLIKDKVIYLDGLEKLLEADPQCAFKQLMGVLVEYPNIKLIASSRKYAVDLIVQKFGLDKEKTGIVEIPTLTDEELGIVSSKYPQLNGVLSNQKIRPLLQSPKYLDFAVKALQKSEDDYSKIKLADFKNRLWNILVVDEGNEGNGLPIKRENAFMEIATMRAKQMKLFIQPEQSDAEAVMALVKDEILIKEQLNRRYAPAHDILEDWALTRHISSIYEDSSNLEEFFGKIGKEPAIRRAFRLWLEELLIDEGEKVVYFVREVVDNQVIEHYWVDEVLTAIFRSEDSKSFYDGYEKDLLKEDAKLLVKALHIIRTCCKESDDKSNLLLPIGSGWRETLLFIEKNIGELEGIRFNIVSFLIDWHYRLLFQFAEIRQDELMAAKSISLHYVREIESGMEVWQGRNIERKREDLLVILFDLAASAKDEIKELIERSLSNVEDKSWQLRSFYESIIKKCLSGVGNRRLIKELPELITETAWKEWKLRPIEPPEPDSIRAMIGDEGLNNDKCWGVEYKSNFSPSGIYKTPLYNLLWLHPLKGLEFFVQFINYSVDFYVSAKCRYKHQIEEIEFELPDGTNKSIWGAWELWAAYRGLSVTHYLLESLLMSFEKFLIQTAEKNTEISRENLKFIFDYVYKNTNNVAPLAVLSSITIAYPEEVGEAMLPLLKIKEFYEWDLNRSLQEHSALAPMDMEISFAQEERWKFNKLPHRRKFTRGLRDFILDYQYNIRRLNKEVHQIFDQLKTGIDGTDIIWKKTLTDIDVRNHQVGEYDENLGGFPIEPEYEKDVQEFMESGKEQFESDNKSMSYSSQLLQVYENKESLKFSDWQTCYKDYSSSENLNMLFDRPVTLAVVGFRDFSSQLVDAEKEWCATTIVEAAIAIIRDTISRNHELNKSYNIIEKNIALSSFHFLFEALEDSADYHTLLVTMTYMVIAPFSEYEIEEITKYLREQFFLNRPIEGKKLWQTLIRYAGYRKANPYFYGSHNLEELESVQTKELQFIEEQVQGENDIEDVSSITLDSHLGYLLTRAVLMVPVNTEDVLLKEYILHFVSLLVEDLKLEENYSHQRTGEYRQIGLREVHRIKLYLAEVLLVSETSFTKSILDIILGVDYTDPAVSIKSRYREDCIKFQTGILEYTIDKLDKIVANSSDDTFKKKSIDQFWKIWNYLFEKAKTSGNVVYETQLLLDIAWGKQALDWKPLEGKKEVYRQMVKQFGTLNAQSILNVFSTVGDKTFLPEGLTWLVAILKEEPSQLKIMNSLAVERFIKRLFYNHISEIKMNKGLVNDYVWFLDRMVEYGSSEAYLFRENVITYKGVS